MAHLQTLQTENPEQLSRVLEDRNRRYTQLQSGQLSAELTQISLGGIQVLSERLSLGLQLEATPSERYLPFAVLNQHYDAYFCGRHLEPERLIQAAGGEWDIRIDGELDYVGLVFERSAFIEGYIQRHDREPDPRSFESLSRELAPSIFKDYRSNLNRILAHVRQQPEQLEQIHFRRQLADSAFSMVSTVLHSAGQTDTQLKPLRQRSRGVRKVVDYLQSHAHELPTIADLCQVAALSERSLEYGFKEQLGLSPKRYIKMLRLNGARHDLVNGSRELRIMDIAMAWGFFEMGRFAGDYRQLFGELPSETRAQS